MPPAAKAASTGPRSAAASYRGAVFPGRRRAAAPSAWAWPTLWAFLAGVAVQGLGGVLCSLLAFGLLVGADPHRCPVAVGAEGGARPLIGWLAGVCATIALVESLASMTELRNSNQSAVLWGLVAEFVQRGSRGGRRR